MLLKGWALAYLGLTPKQFGELRMPEFWSGIEAHVSEKEADRRHVGELVRGATLRLWNLQVKKQHRISDPAEFWRMPWDEQPTKSERSENVENSSEEERNKMANDFIARLDGERTQPEG